MRAFIVIVFMALAAVLALPHHTATSQNTLQQGDGVQNSLETIHGASVPPQAVPDDTVACDHVTTKPKTANPDSSHEIFANFLKNAHALSKTFAVNKNDQGVNTAAAGAITQSITENKTDEGTNINVAGAESESFAQSANQDGSKKTIVGTKHDLIAENVNKQGLNSNNLTAVAQDMHATGKIITGNQKLLDNYHLPTNNNSTHRHHSSHSSSSSHTSQSKRFEETVDGDKHTVVSSDTENNTFDAANSETNTFEGVIDGQKVSSVQQKDERMNLDQNKFEGSKLEESAAGVVKETVNEQHESGDLKSRDYQRDQVGDNDVTKVEVDESKFKRGFRNSKLEIDPVKTADECK